MAVFDEGKLERLRRERDARAAARADRKASGWPELAGRLHLEDNPDLAQFLWDLANPEPHEHFDAQHTVF